MPAYILDQVLSLGKTAYGMAKSGIAVKWHRDMARGLASQVATTPNKMMNRDDQRLVSSLAPGNMYLFSYDPKLKKELPFYDRFPAIIAFKGLPDGFLGLNLHYIPLLYRAKLLDALLDTLNNGKLTRETKFRISYKMLDGATKFKYFRPCLKRYLYSHVRSKFLEVHPKQWDIAAFLPLARFEKESIEAVYRDSMSKV